MSELKGLGIDATDMRQKFPASVAKVEKWFLENEIFRSNLSKQGIDLTDMSTLGNFIDMIIAYDPRKLYDVFDSLGCRIFILDHPDGGLEGDDPTAFVFYNSIKRESKSAPTRIQAEQLAFVDAFELLNN
jgi:hypothetical protein